MTTSLNYPFDARNTIASSVTVNTFADVRSLVPDIASTALVGGRSSVGDGFGGSFAWDPNSASADDNLNVIAPSSQPGIGRWVRASQVATTLNGVAVGSAPSAGRVRYLRTTGTSAQWVAIDVTGYGADATGVTSSSSAFQDAHDALPDAGGTIVVPNGTFLVGNVTLTKNVTIQLDGALAGVAGQPVFVVNGANMHMRGSQRMTATVTPSSGQAAFVFEGAFPGAVVGGTGAASIHIEHVTFDGSAGGTSVFDASISRTPQLKFYEGDFHMSHCRVSKFTGDALSFGSSFYYLDIRKNYFEENYRAIKAGDNCDGWIAKNTLTQGTQSQIQVSGPNVHVDDNVFLGNGNNGIAEPDIDVVPTISGGTGWVWITRNRFGTERETFVPTRCRIRTKHPSDSTAICAPVWIEKNMFIAAESRAIASVARASNVVTVTMSAAHHIQVSSTARVSISEVTDTSFNGVFTVTSTGANTFTYAQTASDVSSSGGYATAVDIAAIEIDQPVYGWKIVGNHFHQYGVIVNDAAVEQFDLLDHAGHGQFYGNDIVAPRYYSAIPFKNGGRQFDRIEALGLSAHVVDEVPRDTESVGLNNQVYPSEDFGTDWTLSGVTQTPGQTDPWGTTRATKIARDGTAGSQHVSRGIQVASLTGDTLYFKFWAKAGSLDSMLVAIGDDTSSVLLKPVHLRLTSQWQQFKIPLAGWNSAHFHSIAFYPGDADERAGDVYLCAVQASDRDCDYVPTTHAGAEFALDTAIGNRFERSLGVTSIRGVAKTPGGTPSLSNLSGAGTTGTATLETGSTDLAGTIVITPGGAGSTAAGSVKLTFENTRPGANQPTVFYTLKNGATGQWQQRAIALEYGSNMSSFTLLWDNNSVDMTVGDDYRINYFVVDKTP